MIRLTSLIEEVGKEGYNEAYGQARVCQDIVLKAIDKSQFGQHITIKGGVVMASITGDVRRATQDIALRIRHTNWMNIPVQEAMNRLLEYLTYLINLKQDKGV